MKAIGAMLAVVSFFVLVITACNKEKDDNNMAILVLALSGSPAVNPTHIRLYNAGTHNGDLDGRSGADAICAGSANKPAGATNVHALLSIDSVDDEILDMPDSYGYPTNFTIYGPDGTTKIADDWADLMDELIDTSLQSAVVLPDYSKWWTGSDQNGSYGDTWGNCNGFSTASSGTSGQAGASERTDWGWLISNYLPCDESHYIVCICEK